MRKYTGPKLYWRYKINHKWNWRRAKLTPTGRPVPFKPKEE